MTGCHPRETVIPSPSLHTCLRNSQVNFVPGEREDVPRIFATLGNGGELVFRARVFVDFWNFQLNWNKRAGQVRADWTKVPQVLILETEKKLAAAGISGTLSLDETLVYASYNATRDTRLKDWLDNFLDRQPSFRVSTRARREKDRTIHCPECNKDHKECPSCGQEFRWAPEKGVDTAVVTDLLSLASEGAFDVAVLLSSDADYIPAVEWVQDRGLKVVNATWRNDGRDLARSCWASVEIDQLIPLISRD